jgi:TRAP-type C4-dicarboxylate transport system substrate-binding protein
MLEIANRVADGVYREVYQLEADAVSEMKKYGLNIVELSPDQVKQWYDDIDRALPSLVGTAFDRELYNRIAAILASERRR